MTKLYFCRLGHFWNTTKEAASVAETEEVIMFHAEVTDAFSVH